MKVREKSFRVSVWGEGYEKKPNINYRAGWNNLGNEGKLTSGCF